MYLEKSSPAQMPLPIERVGDIQAHFDTPFKEGMPGFHAWIHAAAEQSAYVRSIADSRLLSRQKAEGLAFWTDVMSLMHKQAHAESPKYMWFDDEQGDARRAHYEDRLRDVDGLTEVNAILYGERSFTNEDLIEIVEAHFGALETFLKTGNGKSFWSENIEYVREQVGGWREAQDLGTMVAVGNYLDNQAEEGTTRYGKRMNVVACKMGMLYAASRYIGRAIGLLSIMDEPEEIDMLVRMIADGMQADKYEHGDEYYQSDFAYGCGMLEGFALDRFKELLSAVRIPEKPGAEREIQKWGDKDVVVERWGEDKTIEAVTSMGERVGLQFTAFKQRSIENQGKDEEVANYDYQWSVLMDELDEDLKRKVNDKINKIGSDLPEHDGWQGSPIERLAFGFGFELKTFDTGKYGQPLVLGMNPANVILDPEQTTGDVKEIEEIEEVKWLITKSEDTYMRYESLTQGDLAEIAPEGANAFWLAGTPRAVRYSNRPVDDQGPHVIITPIKFYNITTTPRFV